MKTEKQKLVLEILDNGKYRVDHSRGVLQSFRKNVNEWMDCVYTILPSGYKQNIIHLGRGQNTKITVYLHNLVWLACNGPFPEDKVVKHKDGDPGNCSLGNLELLSLSETAIQSKKITPKGTRVIRCDEITAIKKLLEENPNWSKSQIARELGLNRVSVTRVINKIKSGEKLKWEDMPAKEINKEAIPHYKDKFKI
jgi:hypothetical protein